MQSLSQPILKLPLPPPTPSPLVYTCNINSNGRVIHHVYPALYGLQIGFVNARSVQFGL